MALLGKRVEFEAVQICSMAPAQVLMDLDQERNSETPTKSVAESENGNISEIRDDTGLMCMNNCEDDTFDMDTLPDQQKVCEAGDAVANIIDCVDTSVIVTQEEDPDATECSSSFGNTISGSDDGLRSNLSDAEVESQFHCENGASTLFDGMFRPRKKKLTAHWRRYIRPLMWRCKWIELRVKEFQSQALKYEKELLAYSHGKQFNLEQVSSESSAARLVPLSCRSHRKHVMKRRKRKRLEETVDLPSYMLHHNLFSYYENKKSEADGGSIDDDYVNQVNGTDQNANTVDEFGVNYDWPVLEATDGNDSLEQILWSIEGLQNRVLKIKTQLNKLVSKNATKLSLMDNSSLFVSGDLPTSSAQSPAFSPGCEDEVPVGGLYTPPGHISEYEIGDLVMTESAVSSFGEAASLPDIIESTVGLLSAADVSLDRPQNGDSCADIDDDVLIHNQAAEEELQHFEVSQPMDKAQEPVKEQESKESTECPVSTSEQHPESECEPSPEQPAVGADTTMATEQPVLRSCLGSELNVPKNKRRRVGRRGSLGGSLGRWNIKKVYSRRSSAGRPIRRP